MDQNNEGNKGIDLSGALKSSNSGAQFQNYRIKHDDSLGIPKVVQWVIKYSGGFIKNEKQANYMILGFAAVAILIFLLVVFGGGSKIPVPSTPGPDYYALPSQK